MEKITEYFVTMIYQKYIIKLLFSRFFAILLCVSIFGVFQEITKGELLKICTFWQALLIIFLLLPMVLFSFLPFVHLGTLFVVLDGLYSNNELISFKAIGLSHRQLMKVFLYFTLFVLGFFVFLGLLYPVSNTLFYRQKSIFGAGNVLKMLQPGKINKFGEYEIIFYKKKGNKLYDVMVLANNNVSSKNKNGKTEEKAIFSKTMSFSYNEFHELVVSCTDADILIINNDSNKKMTNEKKILVYNNGLDGHDKLKNGKTNSDVVVKRAIHSKKLDALFDALIKTQTSEELKYKQQLRRMGLISVLNKKTFDKHQQKIKKLELHGRAVVYWFVISAITYVCCMLLVRQNNRIPMPKIMFMVFTLSSIISLSRAFLLESLIMSRALFLYYFCCFLICVFFNYKIRKQDFC